VDKVDDALICPVLTNGRARDFTHLKQAISQVYTKSERVEIFRSLERTNQTCKVCDNVVPWSRWDVQAWPTAWSSVCSVECGRKVKRVVKDSKAKNLAISAAKKKFFATTTGKAIAAQVGEKNSKTLKEFYSTDVGQLSAKSAGLKISTAHRADIAAGKWTPGIHNRWTHWTAKIGTKKFRSSWEACFWFCNQHLEYEVFRCPYFDKTANRQRTYVGDFWDAASKTLYEIKPSAAAKKEQYKISQVQQWCNTNGVNFVLVTESNILQYFDQALLSANEEAKKQYAKSNLWKTI
jgi:hypothetical protein